MVQSSFWLVCRHRTAIDPPVLKALLPSFIFQMCVCVCFSDPTPVPVFTEVPWLQVALFNVRITSFWERFRTTHVWGNRWFFLPVIGCKLVESTYDPTNSKPTYKSCERRREAVTFRFAFPSPMQSCQVKEHQRNLRNSMEALRGHQAVELTSLPLAGWSSRLFTSKSPQRSVVKCQK